MYTPVNPSFTIQKLGLKGSTIYRHFFLDIRDGGISWVALLIVLQKQIKYLLLQYYIFPKYLETWLLTTPALNLAHGDFTT